MDRNTVQGLLRLAISNLVVDEWRLLATRTTVGSASVYEPSVAFALAWYLKGLLPREWDVDCDYNRAVNEDGTIDVKRLAESGSPVRPDIIVHRRGLRGPENNLLVVELKTNASLQVHVGGSQESVRQLQIDYQYQHAVLLDLQLLPAELNPHWAWRERNQRGSGSRAVFAPATLVDLVDRGRAEEQRRY